MRPPSSGQLVVQAAGGIGVLDGDAFHQQHRTGIQAFFHLHDGHAGLCIARLDRAVDRGGAAPARQDRAVDIDAGLDVEGGARQDQAVGRDHHHVVVRRQQALVGGAGLFGALRILGVHAQRQRLQHLDAVRQGDLLDARCLQLHAAPGRTVRLGQHQRHREAGFEQRTQGDRGEFRRAGKDDFQAHVRRPCGPRSMRALPSAAWS
jgi:hypothetical protein